jgi:hypothetical protein
MEYSVQIFDGGLSVARASGEWPTGPTEVLLETIRKWEWLVAYLENSANNEIPSTYGEACALCIQYYDTGESKCSGCPVFNVTKRCDCHGTPYWDYRFEADSMAYNDGPHKELALDAARREVEFLKSLLPENK